jgi:hypothetical protein
MSLHFGLPSSVSPLPLPSSFPYVVCLSLPSLSYALSHLCLYCISLSLRSFSPLVSPPSLPIFFFFVFPKKVHIVTVSLNILWIFVNFVFRGIRFFHNFVSFAKLAKISSYFTKIVLHSVSPNFVKNPKLEKAI